MPESGLELSAALIDQTVHQAAHSVAPLGPELAQQLEQAVIVNKILTDLC